MGHCVGGLSLFMAIGAGLEGLRSATFSALAGHPIPTVGNQVRAGIRMATLFKTLGIIGLNTDYDRHALPDKAVEALMRALPFRHVYDSPVARRIYFVYGDVFQYENINKATMDEAVPGFFGNGNITFFEHISLMIRASAARDAEGEDVYLSNLDAYRMPINFLTGENNRMFVPKGLQRTYDTLRKANDPGLYRTTSSRTTRTSTCGSGPTRSATPSRPPSPSWSATTDEHHRRREAPRGRSTPGLQDFLSYPFAEAIQDRRTRRVAQGVSLPGGPMSYESAQRPVAADAGRGGDPDRLHERHRRGHARRPARQAQRLQGARHDVPGGRRPGRLERRQRAGDVVLHDQRRGRVADPAPAGPRGDGPLQGDPARAGRTAPRTTG